MSNYKINFSQTIQHNHQLNDSYLKNNKINTDKIPIIEK